MPELSAIVRLTGGYTRFLQGVAVKLALEEDPIQLDSTVFPWDLLQRNRSVELNFSAKRRLKGSGLRGLKWEIAPKGAIRATVLGPGAAFLGNFRVPENQFGVQWRVDASVTSGLRGRSLFSVKAGSTLTQFWVRVFSPDTTLVGALQAAWRHYLNPFEPEEAWQLENGQVQVVTWKGSCNLSTEVAWDLAPGWRFSSGAGPVDIGWSVGLQAGMSAGLRFSQNGTYSLRLARWRGRLGVSLNRSSSRAWEGGLRVRAKMREDLRLASKSAWFDSLLDPLERTLRKAVSRKAELALVLEAARSRGRKQLLRLNWKKPSEQRFKEAYGGLLNGFVPKADAVTKVSGRIEVLAKQRMAIHLNLFSWIQLGAAREESEYSRATLTPRGDILVEVGVSRKTTRYRNDELEFVRLLFLHRTGVSAQEEYEWNFEHSGRFSQQELRRLLRAALHVRAIPRYVLTGSVAEKLKLDFLWVSRLTAAGIERIRHCSQEELWKALIRALELSDPSRYAVGGFLRDWIDSAEVRQTIDRDPVHSHLRTRYPISGRTDFQRRQVVADYRRTKRLSQLMNRWRQGVRDGVVEIVKSGLGLPLFLILELLCPKSEKSSALMVRGDLERIWGDLELLGGGGHGDPPRS